MREKCRRELGGKTPVIDRAGLAHIELFSLDPEGFEGDVLEGMDFNRHPVRHILVETSNLATVEAHQAMVEAVLAGRHRLVDTPSHHDHLLERVG